MAQTVGIGNSAEGKLRSFWVGLGLTIITLGIYNLCWYYFINDELRDIGRAKGDESLASSNPAMSVIAVLIGGIVVVPPLISVYNTGKRIRQAQRLCGVPEDDQINPTVAFLMLLPGGILIIPYFLHYWYLTKHQNIALQAAASSPAVAPVAA